MFNLHSRRRCVVEVSLLMLQLHQSFVLFLRIHPLDIIAEFRLLQRLWTPRFVVT